jgi:hypothetical protein
MSFWRLLHIARWVLVVLAFLYIALVIYSYPHLHKEHLANAAAAKIEAQKLTPDDVDGAHLPPPPDRGAVDATVAGADANRNGIRDDVELAIFAKYPTSTAVRAAELQYAMDIQTQVTEVFDPETWKAAAIQRDRGFGCLYDASPEYAALEKEVNDLVLDTENRTEQLNSIQRYGVSYKLSSGPDCDVIRE